MELLSQCAEVPEIVRASLHAAESGLKRVPYDEGFTRVLTTIFDLVDAFQEGEATDALRSKGFAIDRDAFLFEYAMSFGDRADKSLASLRSKSDLAEIAKNSFIEVMTREAMLGPHNIFTVSGPQVEEAIKSEFTGKGLQYTMHEFFVTFTNRYLSYYLSRELSNHVGVGKAFANIEVHTDFNTAFETYIRQTVRITDEFTPGWFHNARDEERLSQESVSRFAHVAFKKIRSEFRRGAVQSG
jgi:hypothetical protein